MSTLVIAHDSRLLMLEFAIDKLFVPSKTPFDSVILSKYVVSFRFLDDEWIDVAPNRLDYKEYHGSCGEEHRFHGGKSVVFSLSAAYLTHEFENLALDVCARREISRYFERDEHVAEIGRARVNVDELMNGIVEELRVRRRLGDYLSLVHEKDPISRTLKGCYALRTDTTTTPTESRNAYVEIYLRLSHLGDCVITEIDRPTIIPQSNFFAQEQTNLTKPYLCRELDAPIHPDRCIPLDAALQGLPLECVCTDEQRCQHQLMLQDMRDACVSTEFGDKSDKGDGDGKKKKKRKRVRDRSTGTDAGTKDTGTGMDVEVKKDDGEDKNKKKKDELSYDELLKLLKARRRGAGGTVGFVDKERPCEPIETSCAIPCCVPQQQPICVTTKQPVCLPAGICRENVCSFPQDYC